MRGNYDVWFRANSPEHYDKLLRGERPLENYNFIRAVCILVYNVITFLKRDVLFERTTFAGFDMDYEIFAFVLLGVVTGIGAATQTVSTAVIFFELTSQLSHMVPVMTACTKYAQDYMSPIPVFFTRETTYDEAIQALNTHKKEEYFPVCDSAETQMLIMLTDDAGC
eukprot:jgi/Phyca11/15050/fgenesh1_pg.PHYCAscaffold_11_\